MGSAGKEATTERATSERTRVEMRGRWTDNTMCMYRQSERQPDKGPPRFDPGVGPFYPRCCGIVGRKV